MLVIKKHVLCAKAHVTIRWMWRETSCPYLWLLVLYLKQAAAKNTACMTQTCYVETRPSHPHQLLCAHIFWNKIGFWWSPLRWMWHRWQEQRYVRSTRCGRQVEMWRGKTAHPLKWPDVTVKQSGHAKDINNLSKIHIKTFKWSWKLQVVRG